MQSFSDSDHRGHGLGKPLTLLVLGATMVLCAGLGRAQTQTPPPAEQPQQAPPQQDVPDAPSAVQPPPAHFPDAAHVPPAPRPESGPPPTPPDNAGESSSVPDRGQTAPPPAPLKPLPPGGTPRNQINPKEETFKIITTVNFVQVPVTVKDDRGRRVDGLLSSDFSVLENGKKQNMTFFTSDPFELAVAVVIDLGMPDSAVQKVNQTFPALVGAFSPYDEVAVYTYSSTVSQVSDFSGLSQRLTAVFNEMKIERGRNSGVPVLGGPMASGPTVNGAPAGGPMIQPVNTPPRESHVLNDAILRAALDLSKRERTRRKVIFVISDGRELGSKAGYSDVLHLLQTQGIQVKAVVTESGALPVYNKLERLHLPLQGYGNLLPKYSAATGGGQVYSEISRNAIESAYAEITSEARNQYTLGYTTRQTASSAYREIEVRVKRPGLKIYAKDGYYPLGPGAAQ